MEFRQLTQDYQDDHLAEALYAREMEWFHYDFDRENFMRMLADLPAGPYRESIKNRLADTLVQMDCVERVYAALASRVSDSGAHERAVKRCWERREKKTDIV